MNKTYEKYMTEISVGKYADTRPDYVKAAEEEEHEPKLDMTALINLKILAQAVGLDTPESIMSLRKGIGRLEKEVPLNWAQAGPLLKILRKILSSDKAKLKNLLR
jgi:hypothetical protein